MRAGVDCEAPANNWLRSAKFELGIDATPILTSTDERQAIQLVMLTEYCASRKHNG